MKSYLKTKDFSVSKEDFELYYDDAFDMLVTKPQPKDLAPYCDSKDYISHTDAKKTLVDKMYQRVKRYSLRRKTALINSFPTKEKTLLDMGAGTGDFLGKAKINGWKVTGVEPNTGAREKAMQKGIRLKEGMEDLKGEHFEVITLWHVLEHLPNLEEQLTKITDLLTGDGTLVIAVPNFRSHDAKHYKAHWAAYDVPRHLWHFSRNSIVRLFAAHQMKVVATKPMWFDAFYVSLLSERYRTGKHNPLKAFFIGMISNLKALVTKECSSQMYILKKLK